MHRHKGGLLCVCRLQCIVVVLHSCAASPGKLNAGILQEVTLHVFAQQGPCTDVEFEALPRPQPVPLEGDIIGYRLLHIGTDWTPQVCLCQNLLHGFSLWSSVEEVESKSSL